MRLSLLSGVGAFLAVDWLLKRLNARAARRICAERQARIAEARKRFVARVAEIAAADSWDAAAYEAAASEFSAARARESGSWDSSRAIAAHGRARRRREEAWSLWIDEFRGEVLQLLGAYTVFDDFKTPVAKILGKELESFGDTWGVRRRLRDGTIGKEELESLLRPPPAPGERRRARKGAPVRRLCARRWPAVDSSLIRDGDGEIVGRRPGLKGWLRANCPRLMPHYGSLMRFRRLAAAFREEHGMSDPVPAEALLEGSEAGTPLGKRLKRLPDACRGQIDAARKRAAELLAGSDGRSATKLERLLAERKEQREEEREAAREGMRMAWRRRRETGGSMTA